MNHINIQFYTYANMENEFQSNVLCFIHTAPYYKQNSTLYKNIEKLTK